MTIVFNGIIFGFLLTFLLGPAFFVLLETSIKKGFKSAMFLDIGILLSDAIYLFASIFVAEKINYWLNTYHSIKYIAGSVFIVLGAFSIFKNYKLYKLLEKDLSKNKFFKSKFYNKKNFSFLDKYELIVNCDPSNPITSRYFSKKIVKKYNSSAYTTIIKHDQILNDTAVQIFTKKGPLAFLPISDKKTSVVYSVYNSNNSEVENIKELIKDKNFKYKIRDLKKINSFELKSFNLRSYYHNNILAFGDLLHKVHPLAGQGFNMTIRDIKVLSQIIKKRLDLGLLLDSSVNLEFQKEIKHKNLIFSNGIDLIHEFFNIERKTRTNFLSKSVKLISNNPSINRMFTKIADKGILF